MQNLWEMIYFKIEIGNVSTNRTWMKVNGEQLLSIMGGDAEKLYAQQNTRLDNYLKTFFCKIFSNLFHCRLKRLNWFITPQCITWPDGRSLHRVSPKTHRPRNVDIGVRGMHTEKKLCWMMIHQMQKNSVYFLGQ